MTRRHASRIAPPPQIGRRHMMPISSGFAHPVSRVHVPEPDRAPAPAPLSLERGPVVVIIGGPSAEHDVSIVSGTAIAGALRQAGHAVTQVLIDLDGSWWWLPPDHERGERPAAAYDDPASLGARGPIRAGAAIDRLATAEERPAIFIALHGPFGEDGTIQALLEGAGLAYTGSGVAASALGMDKALFKRMVRGLGLRVVEWREVTKRRWLEDPLAVLEELDRFTADIAESRLIVKPARLGSSVGMSIAHGPGERSAALEKAFEHDTLAIVERYLPRPRELEVGVIGNDPACLEVCGPGEVFPGREFYDYEAKYAAGVSKTVGRAEVSPELRQQLRLVASAAYRAIGAEGFARIDFLLDGETAYVSEINTIPGFTPISLFPIMARELGYEFPSICARIVDLAVEREMRRTRRQLRPEDLPR